MTDFDEIRETARKRALSLLPETIARVDWPRDRLDEYRTRRLRETLTHAVEASPWHRERLSGVDVGAFRLEDLPSLPTMTKADLMDGFDSISTDARVTLARCEDHIGSGALLMDGELGVIASGGTSGVRAVNVTAVSLLAEGWAGGVLRFILRWARRTGAMAGPPSTVVVGAAPGPHGSHLIGRLFGEGGGPRLSVVDPMDDIVSALNAASPDHLIVYSSFVPRLLEEARRGRLRIRPKLLGPVAEPFLQEHEDEVADVWGCAVAGGWAATETGLLGCGSGFEPGMLLLDDLVVIEPVDASGRPVRPGRRADKLFVTPIRPRILPIVRYELTDQLTVLEGPAACGSSFTRIASVAGRLEEQFVYGAITVHPHVFGAVLARRPAITEYQVEQTPRGAVLRVVLAAGRDAPELEAMGGEIREHLARLGLPDPDIRVEPVPAIGRMAASGKLRRFVPLGTAAASALASAGTDA